MSDWTAEFLTGFSHRERVEQPFKRSFGLKYYFYEILRLREKLRSAVLNPVRVGTDGFEPRTQYEWVPMGLSIIEAILRRVQFPFTELNRDC